MVSGRLNRIGNEKANSRKDMINGIKIDRKNILICHLNKPKLSDLQLFEANKEGKK